MRACPHRTSARGARPRSLVGTATPSRAWRLAAARRSARVPTPHASSRCPRMGAAPSSANQAPTMNRTGFPDQPIRRGQQRLGGGQFAIPSPFEFTSAGEKFCACEPVRSGVCALTDFRPAPHLARAPSRQLASMASRCARSAAFSSRASSRSRSRYAPLKGLRAARALPSSVRGPVDFSQGFHSRISAACRARRSGVQPLPMLLLQ